jgi:hypothetical protein
LGYSKSKKKKHNPPQKTPLEKPPPRKIPAPFYALGTDCGSIIFEVYMKRKAVYIHNCGDAELSR